MAIEASQVIVVTSDPNWFRLITTAAARMRDPVTTAQIDRNAPQLASELASADVVFADVEALPFPGLPRQQLHRILTRIPALVFYLPTENLTYESTREAFLSGARDLVPRPET